MSGILSGYATTGGTQRYADRAMQNGIPEDHFRDGPDGLTLSSLGMGSYLGAPDAPTSRDMEAAAAASLQSGGINVLDCAINYRFQASERALGAALADMAANGAVQRDEVFVCSKNGFITPDAAVPGDFRQYFQDTYVTPGIVDPSDVAGGGHCMSRSFLADQLARSLQNFGLETLDLMYLHNGAESQIPEVGMTEFLKRLETAFTFYEEARQAGKIRYYGLATWTCFRLLPGESLERLNLENIVQLAERVGGAGHGFRFVQLPFNLGMPEALTQTTQTVAGESLSLLQAASRLGVSVMASVPLLQGQLLGQSLPPLPDLETPAQRCLQFVRSAPGILAPLVGHKQAAHVQDNLAVARVSPLPESVLNQAFFQTAH